MNKQLEKLEPSQHELQSVQQMISGCDSAVVTYGVDKDYNVYKVVTVFSRTSNENYEFENYGAIHRKTLGLSQNICLSKTLEFEIKGNTLKKKCGDFFKILYRTLRGFIIDKCTHDLRKEYEKQH